MEDTDFLLPLKDLAPRESFQWDICKEFFESFGNTEIVDVIVLDVSVAAEREGACVKVDGSVRGKVTTICDRCGGELELPVDLEFALICGTEEALEGARLEVEDHDECGRFFSEDGTALFGTDDDREELILEGGAEEIDLRQTLYDCICLSLPMKKVHEEGKCDPEALKRLAGAESSSARKENDGAAGAFDSPFAGLRGLFENENQN